MCDTNNYTVINGMIFINVTNKTTAGDKMNYREAYNYAERHRIDPIAHSDDIIGTTTLRGV